MAGRAFREIHVGQVHRPDVITLILLALLFGLLALSIWVFASLLVVAVVGLHFFTGAPVLGVLGQSDCPDQESQPPAAGSLRAPGGKAAR
ncbi:MAG: hypothetical protein WD273_04180 [Trueperaceae bacterium]